MGIADFNFTPRTHFKLQKAGRALVATLAAIIFILLIVGNVGKQARTLSVTRDDPLVRGSESVSYYLYRRSSDSSYGYQNASYMAGARATAVVAIILAAATTALAIAFAVFRSKVHHASYDRMSIEFPPGSTVTGGRQLHEMSEGVTPYQRVAYDQGTPGGSRMTKEKFYYDANTSINDNSNTDINNNNNSRSYDDGTPLRESHRAGATTATAKVQRSPRETKLRKTDYSLSLALVILLIVQTTSSFLCIILIPGYIMKYESLSIAWGSKMEVGDSYVVLVVATALEVVTLSLLCCQPFTGFCVNGYQGRSTVAQLSYNRTESQEVSAQEMSGGQEVGVPMFMNSTHAGYQMSAANAFAATPSKGGMGGAYAPNPANNDADYKYNTNSYGNHNNDNNYNSNMNTNNNVNNNNNYNNYNNNNNNSNNMFAQSAPQKTKAAPELPPPREGSVADERQSYHKDVYVMGEEPDSEERASPKKSTALPPPKYQVPPDNISTASKEPAKKEDDVMSQSGQDIFQVSPRPAQPMTLIHNPALPTANDTNAE